MTFLSNTMTLTSITEKRNNKGLESVVITGFEVVGERIREYVVGFIGDSVKCIPPNLKEGQKVIVSGDVIKSTDKSLFRLLGARVYYPNGGDGK